LLHDIVPFIGSIEVRIKDGHAIRVRSKITSHFQVLRRLPGKAPKHRNIEIFLRFGNAARQEASAHQNAKLFLREPLVK
jgi:hypothetical protein